MGQNGPNSVINYKGLYEQDNFKYLKFGVVKSIKDPDGMGRIKVFVPGSPSVGGDDDWKDGASNIDEAIDNLPYCFPLLPKHLSTIPKVDETVLVFVMDKTKQHVDRFYIGPIISQLDKLKEDKLYANATRAFSFAQITPAKSVTGQKTSDTVLPDIIGVFPNPEDISIQGRYNTDITQKENEIIIRAGKFEPSSNNDNPFKIQFNAKTQAYIQIKNEANISKPDSENPEKGSVTNIVANKINLLTHKDGSPRFDLTYRDLKNNTTPYISDEELTRVLEEAHQLPFGDILLEYLRLLKNAIFSHVHNGNGGPATDLSASGNVQAVAALRSKAEDLENRMLSKNIRIN
jgi:hypothetical protein